MYIEQRTYILANQKGKKTWQRVRLFEGYVDFSFALHKAAKNCNA